MADQVKAEKVASTVVSEDKKSEDKVDSVVTDKTESKEKKEDDAKKPEKEEAKSKEEKKKEEEAKSQEDKKQKEEAKPEEEKKKEEEEVSDKKLKEGEEEKKEEVTDTKSKEGQEEEKKKKEEISDDKSKETKEEDKKLTEPDQKKKEEDIEETSSKEVTKTSESEGIKALSGILRVQVVGAKTLRSVHDEYHPFVRATIENQAGEFNTPLSESENPRWDHEGDLYIVADTMKEVGKLRLEIFNSPYNEVLGDCEIDLSGSIRAPLAPSINAFYRLGDAKKRTQKIAVGKIYVQAVFIDEKHKTIPFTFPKPNYEFLSDFAFTHENVTIDQDIQLKRDEDYLKEYHINAVFNEVLANLIHEQPEDINQFVLNYFKDLNDKFPDIRKFKSRFLSKEDFSVMFDNYDILEINSVPYDYLVQAMEVAGIADPASVLTAYNLQSGDSVEKSTWMEVFKNEFPERGMSNVEA
mmetsp:Transcript_30787/g.35051  ORF Transcript_30787/g.35051 Transcript_30787/m.35051 type:complete len:467 (+) Transcript_30787:24-1424(+)